MLCHVGLLLMGLPREMLAGQSAAQVLHQTLREVLGPQGTLLVPTYSYSFCRGEVYDPLASPSRLGPFGEYFRKVDGVTRSLEPIFSVAGQGPAAAGLFSDLPRDCFGPGCLYERLEAAGAKVLTVGVNLHYFTGLHHLEQLAGVPTVFSRFSAAISARGQGWSARTGFTACGCWAITATRPFTACSPWPWLRARPGRCPWAWAA